MTFAAVGRLASRRRNGQLLPVDCSLRWRSARATVREDQTDVDASDNSASLTLTVAGASGSPAANPAAPATPAAKLFARTVGLGRVVVTRGHVVMIALKLKTNAPDGKPARHAKAQWLVYVDGKPNNSSTSSDFAKTKRLERGKHRIWVILTSFNGSKLKQPLRTNTISLKI